MNYFTLRNIKRTEYEHPIEIPFNELENYVIIPDKYTYYSDAPKTTKFDKFLNGYGMYICILASIIFFVIAILLALINNFPKIIVMIVLGIAFLFLFDIPYIIFKIILYEFTSLKPMNDQAREYL